MLLVEWNAWGGDLFSFWDCCLLLMTGFSGHGVQYFTNLGLQRESAATGALATCSQFVYAFEIMFLHKRIIMWSISGTVLILGFMLIVGNRKMKQADKSIHETVAGEPEEASLLFSSEWDVLPEEFPTE